MIWHRQKDMDPPPPSRGTVFDGLRDQRPQFRARELIESTRLATHSDEPNLLRRIDPQRHLVWKGFAASHPSDARVTTLLKSSVIKSRGSNSTRSESKKPARRVLQT